MGRRLSSNHAQGMMASLWVLEKTLLLRGGAGGGGIGGAGAGGAGGGGHGGGGVNGAAYARSGNNNDHREWGNNHDGYNNGWGK